MVDTQQYRITRQVPLVRIGTFCGSLQNALVARGVSEDPVRVWRLYISAECPKCGMQVSGDELRALALPPCAELATAKIGRMRLGDCARRGCDAWQYSVHFWNQEGVDWPSVLEGADHPERDDETSAEISGSRWFAGLKCLMTGYAARSAGMLGLVFVLWLARECYLGGRIPFLREPEQFAVEAAAMEIDDAWPAPMDGAEGPVR